MNNRMILTARLKQGDTPYNFPWVYGVQVSVFGDLTDLNNLMEELKELKKLVQIDANKFNIKLNDLKITLTEK